MVNTIERTIVRALTKELFDVSDALHMHVYIPHSSSASPIKAVSNYTIKLNSVMYIAGK